MHLQSLFLALWAIKSCASYPFHPDIEIVERDTDCTKPQQTPTPDCWVTLGMTKWLQDWWSHNQQSCGTSPFAECFQFHQNITGQSCSNNTIGGCTAPSAFNYPDPHVFYALWNIYNINVYFSNYWLAIGNANTLVESDIAHLITEFDPPKTTNVALNDLLTALSVVLSFVKVPDIATNIAGGPKDALGALFNAFGQAPGVAKYMFPPEGTLANQFAELAEIGSQASTFVNQYQHNVTSTLQGINGQFDAFLAFANTTAFSNPATNIQFLNDKVLQSLYTYIIAQIMRANNIAVASGPIGDPSQVTQGVDGDVFFDLPSGKGYSMNKLDNIHTNMTKVMNDVFSLELTTPELLFKGAADCNNAAAAPLSFQFSAADAGGAGVKCLSAVQYCMYEPDKIDPGSEFTNCKTQNTFGTNDCKGSDGTSEEVLVPIGYLGAYDNGQRDLCSG